MTKLEKFMKSGSKGIDKVLGTKMVAPKIKKVKVGSTRMSKRNTMYKAPCGEEYPYHPCYKCNSVRFDNQQPCAYMCGKSAQCEISGSIDWSNPECHDCKNHNTHFGSKSGRITGAILHDDGHSGLFHREYVWQIEAPGSTHHYYTVTLNLDTREYKLETYPYGTMGGRKGESKPKIYPQIVLYTGSYTGLIRMYPFVRKFIEKGALLE